MFEPNIVFLDAFTVNQGDLSFDIFSDIGEFVAYDRTNYNELQVRGSNANIAIVNKFPVNEDTLALMPNVRYISLAATGFNNIDIRAVKDRKIEVSNVGGYSKDSVAQHIFSCVLAWINRSQYYANEVRKGRWSEIDDFCFYDHSITELHGKTFGIIGLGNIGKRVAAIANGFGMKVIAKVRNDDQKKEAYITLVDEDQIFRYSDFISLHCPLTDDTAEIINSRNLAKMRSGALLINTGRGGLVDESDLLFALDSGQISGAILDVLSKEPPSIENRLINHPKCMITPHQAWASLESRQNLIEGIAENIRCWLAGQWVNRIY
ncbi:MAG: D-2-hydroxyacid dehydrogenase [Saprospiraceae bacterium]|jgi:glycerate dehydrogenase|nr:D-2-hydroxyacid dehydrogenase [Saprospiraceae bacterium]MBL0025131.1 D-2-hydroxyacid dehydrogenase [Saprospiraceae bacterium]